MIIYSAESRLHDWRRVVRQMAEGLRRGRYLAWRLCRKDIKAEYANSRHGMLWDFIEPLMLGLVFIGLMHARVIQPGNLGMPYAVFVTFGVLLWQTFSDSLTMPMELVKRSRTLLNQLNIPPEALLLSVAYRNLFNSAFRVLILLIISVLFGVLNPVGFVFFLLLFPVMILAGMAIGVLLAPFHSLYNDVGRIVRILLRPLMYASPVMYHISSAEEYFLRHGATGAAGTVGGVPIPLRLRGLELLHYNPIAILLDNLRQLATHNQMHDPLYFWASLAGFTLLLALGAFIFSVSIPILAERA